MPLKETIKRITKRSGDPSKKRRSRKGRLTASVPQELPDIPIQIPSQQLEDTNQDEVDAAANLPAIGDRPKLQPRSTIPNKDIDETVSASVERASRSKQPAASANVPASAHPTSAIAKIKNTISKLVKPKPKPSNITTEEPNTVSVSSTTIPKPSRPATPDNAIANLDESSSGLSSAPTSVGSTPDGLSGPSKPQPQADNEQEYSLRRSSRSRKRSIKASESDALAPASKRRKLSIQPNVNVLSTIEELSEPIEIIPSIEQSNERAETIESVEEPTAANPSSFSPETDLSSEPNKKRRQPSSDDLAEDEPVLKRPRLEDEGYVTKTPEHVEVIKDKAATKPVPKKKQTKAQIAHENRFYRPLTRELAPRTYNDRIWTRFNRTKVIMYGADAQTEYTPAFGTEAPRRGGRNNGRGASRGGRGSTGNGRGRGGRGRGKGRDDDSPEPPGLPKKPQSQEDAQIIKHAKARQAELRRFFGSVGSQQTEILDTMATKDLLKLAKKLKAHKLVEEYEENVAELEAKKGSAQKAAEDFCKIAVETEINLYKAEKEVIESRFQKRLVDIRHEYQQGAQGDLILFRRAIAAAQDETRTQDGSEADFVPQYHECPEPDQTLRGFASKRIKDEKPFKHHLMTYDDQARREVIEDEYGPIIEAFARKAAENRAEEERKKTQTMEALAEEADKQLKEMRGYLIPRPLVREDDINSFALSCLADVSEWMAHKYPNKQYIYMPLEDDDTFPREALNYDKLPDVKVPQPPVPAPRPEVAARTQRNIATKPTLAPTTTAPSTPVAQGSRRSLRNLQPNGPLGQPQPQSQVPVASSPAPATPLSATAPTVPAVAGGPGPVLAPAPPKLAPAPSARQSQPRPPPIDTKHHNQTPTERSPVHSSQHQQPLPPSQPVQGFPPLQPRHMSQSALPPPPAPAPVSQPQPSHYPYPAYSPTHPPPSYGPPHPPPSAHPPPQQQHQQHPLPPPHHTAPQQYQAGPPPPLSPYHQQPGAAPSPYLHYPPPQYHQYPPHYYPPHPPPAQHQHQQPPTPSHQQQQQFTFISPQHGPLQTSPTSQHPPGPQHQHPEPYPNGYNAHNRSLSNPFQQPYQPNAPPPPPPPPQHQQPPAQSQQAPTPVHTTGSKGRPRTKAKQPVTFVNQTLATRKAAAEQLAKEEAAAAAERKKESKEKGRKLAPKV